MKAFAQPDSRAYSWTFDPHEMVLLSDRTIDHVAEALARQYVEQHGAELLKLFLKDDILALAKEHIAAKLESRVEFRLVDDALKHR